MEYKRCENPCLELLAVRFHRLETGNHGEIAEHVVRIFTPVLVPVGTGGYGANRAFFVGGEVRLPLGEGILERLQAVYLGPVIMTVAGEENKPGLSVVLVRVGFFAEQLADVGVRVSPVAGSCAQVEEGTGCSPILARHNP